MCLAVLTNVRVLWLHAAKMCQCMQGSVSWEFQEDTREKYVKMHVYEHIRVGDWKC